MKPVHFYTASLFSLWHLLTGSNLVITRSRHSDAPKGLQPAEDDREGRL